jgi:hypothetical protein
MTVARPIRTHAAGAKKNDFVERLLNLIVGSPERVRLRDALIGQERAHDGTAYQVKFDDSPERDRLRDALIGQERAHDGTAYQVKFDDSPERDRLRDALVGQERAHDGTAYQVKSMTALSVTVSGTPWSGKNVLTMAPLIK